jgi:plastocyanin
VPSTGRLARAVVGVALVAVFAAGCGKAHSTASSAATTSSPAAGAGGVTIKNFAFHPSPLHAKVGQTITVTNADDTSHTFSADDHSFDTGTIHGGASATVTLTHAGTIAYHCNIHNYMQGVIQVSP